MKFQRALEFMEIFGTCPICQNTFIGGGEGGLEVKDLHFIRSCKCGWSIEIMEKGN